MRVQPKPEQLKQLINALLAAFEYEELARLVSFELNEKLAWFTPVNGTLETIVTNLVDYCASKHNGLKNLLMAARTARPKRNDLSMLQTDWAGFEFEPVPLIEDHPHQTVIHGDNVGRDKIEGDKVGRDKNMVDRIEGVAAVGGTVNFEGPVYFGSKDQPDTGTTEAAPGESPYLGLSYFDTEDTHLFFGRDVLTRELVAQLDAYNQSETRFLAVIGASGSGKSSLVRAGLVPALMRGQIDGSNQWMIHLITPKAQPLESLALSLTNKTESVTAANTLMQDMTKTPNSLHLYARRLMTSSPDGTRLLLIVDQFEELFTLCKNQAEQQNFVNNLMIAATMDGPTVILLTLRADFYAQCARFDDLRSAIKKQQEYIGAMTRVELQQAIVEPAKRNGWEFEDGMVELILDDVGNEPGALPLLSHALHETWKRRRGNMMTLAGYNDVGRVKGAIAKTADHIYNGLSSEQQNIARTIFMRLTELGEGAEDTRRRVALTELQPTDSDITLVEDVLKALADARLVTTHESEAEVAHEALIREWKTLRGWLDDDRGNLRTHRHLTEEASEWAKTQDSGLLYRGGRLEQALLWAKAYSAHMNEQEEAFLRASKDATDLEEKEKREAAEREMSQQRALASEQQRRAEEAEQLNKRLRRRALGLGAAVVVALAGVWISIYLLTSLDKKNSELSDSNAKLHDSNAKLSDSNAKLAESEDRLKDRNIVLQDTIAKTETDIRKARAEQLAASSQLLISQVDFVTDTARLLARESFLSTWSTDKTVTVSTLELFPSLFKGNIKQVVQPGEIRSAYFNSSGEVIVSLMFDDESSILRSPNTDPVDTLSLSSISNSTIGLWNSAADSMLEVGYVTNAWSYSSRRGFDEEIDLHRDHISAMAISGDGINMVTVGEDRRMLIWDLSFHEPIQMFQYLDLALAVALNYDGSRVVSITDDSMVRIWNTENGGEIQSFFVDTGRINSLAYESNKNLLVLADDSDVRLLDATSGEEIYVFQGHVGRVLSVAFDPQGKQLISAGFDQTIRIWDVDMQQELYVLRGHTDRVLSAHYSPSGDKIISSSADQIVKVWPLVHNQPIETLLQLNEQKIQRTPKAFTEEEIERYGIDEPIDVSEQNIRCLLGYEVTGRDCNKIPELLRSS